MQLGITEDRHTVCYDEASCEFRLGSEHIAYEKIRALDDRGRIHWRAMEQRDWFRQLNPAALATCGRDARADREPEISGRETAREQVRNDTARNDSIIEGTLIDPDPSLVHAVAHALEKEGLIGTGAAGGAPGVMNPLATADLPEGMESLAQMERARGDRKMTASEKRLMRKILKEHDKAKAKREKEDAKSQAVAEKRKAKEGASAEDAQERPAKSARTSDEPVEYYDRQGNLVARARPAREGPASEEPEVSPEEQALIDMRARNQQIAEEMQSSDIPGMEETRRHRFWHRQRETV